MLSKAEDLRYEVSINQAIRSVSAPVDVDDPPGFKDALIRIQTNQGFYQILENTVAVDHQTLYRTTINMPSK